MTLFLCLYGLMGVIAFSYFLNPITNIVKNSVFVQFFSAVLLGIIWPIILGYKLAEKWE